MKIRYINGRGGSLNAGLAERVAGQLQADNLELLPGEAHLIRPELAAAVVREYLDVAQTPLGRLGSNPYDPGSTAKPCGAGSSCKAEIVDSHE